MLLNGCGAARQGSGAATSSDSESTSGGGTPLAETSTDNQFGTTMYSIEAGQTYTLTLKNLREAIHNWHILDAKGANGKEIQTPLTDAGKTSNVTFVVAKSGTYRFQCDVHPDTMKGTLVVQ
jgi:plastocyanin